MILEAVVLASQLQWGEEIKSGCFLGFGKWGHFFLLLGLYIGGLNNCHLPRILTQFKFQLFLYVFLPDDISGCYQPSFPLATFSCNIRIRSLWMWGQLSVKQKFLVDFHGSGVGPLIGMLVGPSRRRGIHDPCGGCVGPHPFTRWVFEWSKFVPVRLTRIVFRVDFENWIELIYNQTGNSKFVCWCASLCGVLCQTAWIIERAGSARSSSKSIDQKSKHV